MSLKGGGVVRGSLSTASYKLSLMVGHLVQVSFGGKSRRLKKPGYINRLDHF